jgi:hypothetical protein
MMTYTPRFYVWYNGRHSRPYLMNRALELARRMRRRGCTVGVGQIPR